MAASPSGTDEDTFDRLANGRFLWSIITNKAGVPAALAGGAVGSNMYLRLDTYDPDHHANHASPFRSTFESCTYRVLIPDTVDKAWFDAALANVQRTQPAVHMMQEPHRRVSAGRRSWTYPQASTRMYDDDDFADAPIWSRSWAQNYTGKMKQANAPTPHAPQDDNSRAGTLAKAALLHARSVLTDEDYNFVRANHGDDLAAEVQDLYSMLEV